ncbi:MAG: type B 50S ribosomal protein L31 [Phycisphaerales bacterium]|jgi:large subunit ribosomal protein L31|nr:type B 50S ribosomal protein L31 [Phycisphaerales bacterium]
MKDGIHPEYREVVFQDVSADFTIITRTTANSKKTIEIDGKEYPLIRVDISSASHPFYTGKEMLLDTAGRVEKFNRKFNADGFKDKLKK